MAKGCKTTDSECHNHVDDDHPSTVFGDLYARNDEELTRNEEELTEIAQNFFPMIVDAITRLASTL
jgi:hypothetical protein